ncbi:ferric reduction oxidase 8, mitochondrial [Vigna radiata var. radiata]|uniref:Ferric reduction oxidase 8, mitochondrial n=1 Tax=Vigna radiata var. radiata TaxID=3916 RepID=A0A1S3TA06_VIGRR|nr:ferric reduction oxidase 8, mitochondrial [Vigna radiata var. radiata]
MTSSTTLLAAILKLLIIFLFAGWVALWLLKPTQIWTRKWKQIEDSANNTIFGYYGLGFSVYTFPVIAIAIIGLLLLDLKAGYQSRSARSPSKSNFFSNPLVVNSTLGILSSIEILVAFLFIVFLAWTYYSRISSDFKKLVPYKSLKLNTWQLKYHRVATRFGLLSEACLALLLLPILRGLAVFRVLGIQFEASVRYHTWVGTAMIIFATIHGASTFLVWGISHHIQDEIWKWQKTGRIYLAGEITLVVGLVIWVTSLPQIRRRKFEIFYYTHHFYVIFLVFFLFHGGDRHFYTVFPGIFLFSLDKLIRIIQSSPKTCMVSARIFPGKAVELILPKDPELKYNPTSVIFLKIPTISHLQWHSFSIISSSRADNHILSVIIKCEGWWTNSLHDLINAELDKTEDKRKGIPVAIEGPYGPASLDFLRYDTLLLVAGGSGITPFLSILAEANSAASKSKFPSRIQLVYVIKKAEDFCLLHSISHMLLNQSTKSFHLNLKLFVTRETQAGVGIRELLNEFFKARTLQVNSVCSNYAAYGPESPSWMAAIAGFCSITFLIFLICFNHIIIPSGKRSKMDKEKTPSWVVDLLLIAAFVLALACSASVAGFLRWRRLKKGIPQISHREIEALDLCSDEARNALEAHEVYFGGRPNFKEIFGKLRNESDGSNIGVLVCGPESMKESVALACKQESENFNAKRTESFFTFHTLNFTL